MQLERRAVLALLAKASGVLAGAWMGFWRQRTFALTASTLAARSVQNADASALQAIMTASVRDADAFYGKCGGWSLGWATDLITRCPHTVLLTENSSPIAFLELPPIRPELPALGASASDAEREQYALRVQNRTTFRVTAAGIRDDLLTRTESVRVFQKVLYYGFVEARRLGYREVEALAPWEQHPRLARKWTDYPGCRLVEPVSRSQDGGADVYCLRWTLDDAIAALAAEGAAEDQLRVA